MSIDELANTTPVKPPTTNKKIKPKAQYIGTLLKSSRLVPYKVANQLNTFNPVGKAIIIVAAVKYARVSTSYPTVNMWWAQTKNPKNPINNMAHTIEIFP